MINLLEREEIRHKSVIDNKHVLVRFNWFYEKCFQNQIENLNIQNVNNLFNLLYYKILNVDCRQNLSKYKTG